MVMPRFIRTSSPAILGRFIIRGKLSYRVAKQNRRNVAKMENSLVKIHLDNVQYTTRIRAREQGILCNVVIASTMTCTNIGAAELLFPTPVAAPLCLY